MSESNDPALRALRCEWRLNQRCQHELGHEGNHMVMPLKPFDFMDPYGKPYPALAAAAEAAPLDVDDDGKEICDLSYLCPHHPGKRANTAEFKAALAATSHE